MTTLLNSNSTIIKRSRKKECETFNFKFFVKDKLIYF